ncbi:MAG TPA: alanine racemase [Actinomycetes bacterium]|nr:alanine racemase [Actinomycetes bacterium]
MSRARPWPGVRPAWVEVDLDAIAGNLRQLAAEVAPAQLMAVVKADAYGHGAVPVARTAVAAGARWLGVALVEEALELRGAGISAPILVLSEPHPAAADLCVEQRIAVTLCTPAGVRVFGMAGRLAGRPVPVHLKVDTGMHRQGCAPAELPELVRLALVERGLRVEGLWSHFAVADEPAAAETTDRQLAAFQRALAVASDLGLDPRWRHLANSAGATLRGDARFDMVRIGIELYGLAPAPALGASVSQRLRPALSLRAAVSAVRAIEAGERVSYGHRWAAPRDTRIATLPVGYADGVRRGLSGRIRVLLGERDLPQVGTITMDQLMLDIGNAPIEVGDVATLLGDPARGEPGVGEWARVLDSIDYEVTCGLSPRLPRVHHQGGHPDGERRHVLTGEARG